MSTRQYFARIFANTDSKYLASCLKMRNPGPKSVGSVFDQPQTIESLATAEWVSYCHTDVKEPAQAFQADIPGHVGVMPLADLLPDTVVVFDDRKETGNLEVVVPNTAMMPAVSWTTLLVGPDREEPEKTVVWTFFPGNPIMPSQIPTGEEHNHGDKITAAKAMELGLEFAKVEALEVEEE